MNLFVADDFENFWRLYSNGLTLTLCISICNEAFLLLSLPKFSEAYLPWMCNKLLSRVKYKTTIYKKKGEFEKRSRMLTIFYHLQG